ncbi:MAG: cytochrome c [Trueperaceae bacterium]|nr:cytochrome c [Trueperaceae bacterium]
MSLDRNGFLIAVIVFLAAAGLAVGFYFVGTGDPDPAPFRNVPGDPVAGRIALERIGCGSCHAIDGVRVGGGRVGPALNDLRQQRYIAGRLPNTPDNVVRFILDPQGVSPGSAMPDLRVVDAEARNMVAYLYTLGGR